MTKNILLPFLLLHLSFVSANRYNAKCSTASDCDQYQACYYQVCLCNKNERRFWTGEMCAVCVLGFTVTDDRCYQRVDTLKTWPEARQYCRDRYADLFTWRDNRDEQFIEPMISAWIQSATLLNQVVSSLNHIYIAWAGAKITSVNPHTTQWMDPAGIQLTYRSNEWCDPTLYAGYNLPKEPTSKTRQTNQTEREECVTFNIAFTTSTFLCLADDFCNEKHPFICEMNTASMKLANTVSHGSDGDDINFQEQVSVPPPLLDASTVNPYPPNGMNPNDGSTPAALANSSSGSSATVYIIIIVVIVLIIGGIVGFVMIKKKKKATSNPPNKAEEAADGRSSFTSSVGSMVE